MAKRIEIQNYPGLVFIEEPHEYYLDGVQLPGITGFINELYPGTYENVPQRILSAAASYGKNTHSILEDHDVRWKTDTESVELADYISMCQTNQLVHEASELLITDGKVASAIDKVYRVSNDTFHIADVKCYYGKITGEKLEKVRWQLSLYKMLFLANYPKAKVDKLMIIHLYNKPKRSGEGFNHTSELIYVDPIPAEICQDFLDHALNNDLENFKNPFAIPTDLAPKVKRIKELTLTLENAKLELDAIKADILESMELMEIKNWATNEVRLTRKLPTTRSSFDLQSFKAGHPEITDYDEYRKTTQVQGSLQVSVVR